MVQLGRVCKRGPSPGEAGQTSVQKNKLKPWFYQQWVMSKLDAAFITQMEMVLDLYEQPYDPKRPVVCLDEVGSHSHRLGRDM